MPFLSWDPTVDDEEFSTNGAYASVEIPEDLDIPILDKDAWDAYPKYQHLYNKLFVNKSAGVKCNLIGASRGPRKFPVIVRPVYNLFGMGHQARRVFFPADFEQLDLSGHFWAEKINGAHYSWDLAIVGGRIAWAQTWIGKRHPSNEPGMMSHWSTREASAGSERRVAAWVEENLEGFTGMINLETIGGMIIECHLRVGDVLYMCNSQLLQAIVDLYASGEWTFDGSVGDFHMFPIWARRGSPGWPKNSEDRQAVLDVVKENFDIWAVEDEEDWPGDPLYANRVLMLGSKDFAAGQAAQKKIQEMVTQPIMHISV